MGAYVYSHKKKRRKYSNKQTRHSLLRLEERLIQAVDIKYRSDLYYNDKAGHIITEKINKKKYLLKFSLKENISHYGFCIYGAIVYGVYNEKQKQFITFLTEEMFANSFGFSSSKIISDLKNGAYDIVNTTPDFIFLSFLKSNLHKVSIKNKNKRIYWPICLEYKEGVKDNMNFYSKSNLKRKFGHGAITHTITNNDARINHINSSCK